MVVVHNESKRRSSKVNTKQPVAQQTEEKIKINKMVLNILQYNRNQRENVHLLEHFYAAQNTHEPYKQYIPITFNIDALQNEKVKEINRGNLILRRQLCKIENRNHKAEVKAKAKGLQCQLGKFKLPAKILKKYNRAINIPEDPCRQFKLFRPSIYMDLVAIGERPIGRLTFQLYTEACPMIVLELVRFFSKGNGEALHFPRIYGPLWAECEIPVEKISYADNMEYDMRALDNGEAAGIISFDFKDLKFLNRGFLLLTISFKPLSVANGKRIAIGRMINGRRNLIGLSEYGTKNGVTLKRIAVSELGLAHN